MVVLKHKINLQIKLNLPLFTKKKKMKKKLAYSM